MENKTFGVKLAELRKANGMTQLDLADKLGVTDKAVSKWERDLALPEVENLIKISDMFEVSLDSLLRGEERKTDNVESTDVVEPPKTSLEPAFPARKIIGTILLCFGGALWLILLLLSADILGSLIFSSPFLLCGTVFMIAKKRHGLLCCWALFWAVYVYLCYAIGMSIMNPVQIVIQMLRLGEITVQFIVALVALVVFAILTVWTVISFKKESIPKKDFIWFIIAPVVMFISTVIVSYIVSAIYSEFIFYYNSVLNMLYRMVLTLFSFVKLSSFVVLVAALVNKISNRSGIDK